MLQTQNLEYITDNNHLQWTQDNYGHLNCLIYISHVNLVKCIIFIFCVCYVNQIRLLLLFSSIFTLCFSKFYIYSIIHTINKAPSLRLSDSPFYFLADRRDKVIIYFLIISFLLFHFKDLFEHVLELVSHSYLHTDQFVSH